jgi:hypothetical protein
VGNVSTGLDREHEIVCHAISPVLEGFLEWQLVKGIVDLDSLKFFGIVIKKVFLWEAFGIERTDPMIVMPARSSNMNPV